MIHDTGFVITHSFFFVNKNKTLDKRVLASICCSLIILRFRTSSEFTTKSEMVTHGHHL